MEQRLLDFIRNQPELFPIEKNFNREEFHDLREGTVPTYVEMSNEQKKLPAYGHEKDISKAIKEEKVAIISGQTGSGKTTQVPQYILNECAKNGEPALIICTQPRRLAATAVANRVAIERKSKLGYQVGYQIKNDQKVSANSSLIFMTR